MMEHEYCLLGYQNKCTTEWGLLSFIHMQSHSNEHPLHNPSRTWPSLKALQQCGLFYPTTALKNPLIRRWTQLIRSPSSVCFAAACHAHIVGSHYLWLFICLTESEEGSEKSHWQNRWLRPTSDFLAVIWTMTSSAAVLLSAASELEGPCTGGVEESAAFSGALSISELRLSETAYKFRTERILLWKRKPAPFHKRQNHLLTSCIVQPK